MFSRDELRDMVMPYTMSSRPRVVTHPAQSNANTEAAVETLYVRIHARVESERQSNRARLSRALAEAGLSREVQDKVLDALSQEGGPRSAEGNPTPNRQSPPVVYEEQEDPDLMV